jgi:Fic family protein
LPPDIAWDLELSSTLADASLALGELAGLGRTMPSPQLLVAPFLRLEAVLSSRIEGTQAGVTNVYAYEAGQLVLPGVMPDVPQADVQEVVNYVRALEYGVERVKTLPLSLRLLRELHAILMESVRGSQLDPGMFRRQQNWIGGSLYDPSEASYVPPPVHEMYQSLNDLEKYLNVESLLPPLLRIGLIHYQFEAIHPFLNGNGRIGRLLITPLLIEWGLLPFPLLYLSAFFERYRQTYCDCLQAVSERGAWREWLLFFLKGVAEQSRDACRRAKELQDVQINWRNACRMKVCLRGPFG